MSAFSGQRNNELEAVSLLDDTETDIRSRHHHSAMRSDRNDASCNYHRMPKDCEESAHGTTAAKEAVEEAHESYVWVCVLIMIYCLAIGLSFPAIPALILAVTGNDSAASSYYNGIAIAAKYILEFFCSPILGTVSDIKGRKHVMTTSFVVCGSQLLIFALAPSITMLIITHAISGLADVVTTTSYAIITDIATYNGDNVTQKYGLIGAMFGATFIVGPFTGGLIASYSIRLCLLLSAGIALIGALISAFCLKETVNLNRPVPAATNASASSSPDASPHMMGKVQRAVQNVAIFSVASAYDALSSSFHALHLHLSNHRMRDLTIPYAFTSLAGATMTIFYLYTNFRYHVNSTEIGIFVSFIGLITLFVMGVLVRWIIPNIWDERRAAVYGAIFTVLNSFCVSLSPTFWGLYVSNAVFCLGALFHIALKAIIVEESLLQPEAHQVQGNLQGVLNSISTICNAVGAFLFSTLFSVGVRLRPTPMPNLPFLAATVLQAIALLTLLQVMPLSTDNRTTATNASVKEDDDQLQNSVKVELGPHQNSPAKSQFSSNPNPLHESYL